MSKLITYKIPQELSDRARRLAGKRIPKVSANALLVSYVEKGVASDEIKREGDTRRDRIATACQMAFRQKFTAYQTADEIEAIIRNVEDAK